MPLREVRLLGAPPQRDGRPPALAIINRCGFGGTGVYCHYNLLVGVWCRGWAWWRGPFLTSAIPLPLRTLPLIGACRLRDLRVRFAERRSSCLLQAPVV